MDQISVVLCIKQSTLFHVYTEGTWFVGVKIFFKLFLYQSAKYPLFTSKPADNRPRDRNKLHKRDIGHYD